MKWTGNLFVALGGCTVEHGEKGGSPGQKSRSDHYAYDCPCRISSSRMSPTEMSGCGIFRQATIVKRVAAPLRLCMIGELM